ncbi:MAG: hypothetical protein AAFW75_20420 [Cyanobacteria bacterium J06636_16]
MSFLNHTQEKSLKAFLTALAQQDESLPPGLQKQLHTIGQNLENRVVELPTIAASLPGLSMSYQAALTDVETNAGESGAMLVSTDQDESTQLRDRAAQIFTNSDSVKAA